VNLYGGRKLGRELGQRGALGLLLDANFTLRKCRPLRRLDLLGDALVRLLRAFPDRFTVPVEFVPPDFPALVDGRLTIFSSPGFSC
jgi:hypothetical protein